MGPDYTAGFEAGRLALRQLALRLPTHDETVQPFEPLDLNLIEDGLKLVFQHCGLRLQWRDDVLWAFKQGLAATAAPVAAKLGAILSCHLPCTKGLRGQQNWISRSRTLSSMPSF
jgi:hypothetical protein